ncbi:MAG: hypothetical protein RIQ89_1091 [Bacteroidota bacterium]|jgi:KDO2-lipid IV(A) lauroyltransferase
MLIYYLLLLPLSKLPLSALYKVSDFFFFILFHVIGYRKAVVFDNLTKCFPEKSSEEINKIAKSFYKHLCDIIIESIKVFSIKEAELLERIKVINPEALNAYFDKGQSVIGITGHYGNWEWLAISLSRQSKLTARGIYSPLKNEFLNKKLIESRTRFGTEVCSTKMMPDFIKSSATPYIYGFVGDQNPFNIAKAVWVKFLGRDTAFMYGAEHYARKHEMPCAFGIVHKVKRGYYEVQFSSLTDKIDLLPIGEIISLQAALLETEIRKKPEYWLWSHRRWKHTKPLTQ